MASHSADASHIDFHRCHRCHRQGGEEPNRAKWAASGVTLKTANKRLCGVSLTWLDNPLDQTTRKSGVQYLESVSCSAMRKEEETHKKDECVTSTADDIL